LNYSRIFLAFFLLLLVSISGLSSTIPRAHATNGSGGRIFLTGHDPDHHAQPPDLDPVAAQNLLRVCLGFARGASTLPVLLVMHSLQPVPDGYKDSSGALSLLGVPYVQVDASTLRTFSLSTSAISAIFVPSDFGGLLAQAELDALVARKPDILSYLHSGGGVCALSENDEGPSQLATTGFFDFLPFSTGPVSLMEVESGFSVTAFGASLGLTDSDVNGNVSHNRFANAGGLQIVDTDSSGQIISLAGVIEQSQLEIRTYSFLPDVPVEGQLFTLNMVAENNGETAILLPRELVVSSATPTLDAAGNAPSAYCNLSGPYKLQVSQQSTISYSCIAYWNFVPPPNVWNTLTETLTDLGKDAIGDIISYGVLSHYKSILNQDQYKIFENGWNAIWGATWGTAQNVYDTADALGEVVELFRHNGVSLGVTYDLSFPQNLAYTVGIDTGQMQATVVAPEHKFDEAVNWAQAKVVAVIASAVLGAASTATLGLCATAIGCLVPGLLLAASVLVGPVTNVYYTDQLEDPSPFFTLFVAATPPPASITALPNNTFTRTLLYEYEYVSNLNASVESSARGAAAFQALSLYYARLQYDRANYFAENAAKYFTLFQFSLNSTLSQINPLNQTAYDTGIQELKTNGLPTGVRGILGELGFNSFVNVTALTQMSFQKFNFPTVIGSLFDAGSALYNSTLLHREYVSAPRSSTTVSAVQRGRGLFDQTNLTGVTVNVTASSASDGTTANATVTILSQQPSNTGWLNIVPVTFLDLQVRGLPDGDASICVTSQAITSETTVMQYWNGSTWKNAGAVSVSVNKTCGSIPVRELIGTTITIGAPLSLPSKECTFTDISCSLILQIVSVAALIVGVGFTFFYLRRRSVRKKKATS